MTSDPGLQFRAVDAFADLAEELALAGPLAVGVDDLQWADPSSLLTLGTLAQEGAITTAAGQAEATAMTLPPTLRLTILRRLSFCRGPGPATPRPGDRDL